MSIKNKEYLFSVDNFKNPRYVEGKNSIAMRLMELMLMNQGQERVHPEMGIRLKKFRYGQDTLEELKDRIQNQIETYLPMYQNVNIAMIRTPDKLCNIEISVGDMTYVYESKSAPVPIKLDDIKSN